MEPVALAPRRVLLIRHAEKTGRPEDQGLSDLGRLRAAALACVLPARFGRPEVLVACRSSPRSRRPLETVAPLAEKLGLPVEERWGTSDVEPLGAALDAEPRFADRLVLICWRHKTLGALARRLGAPEAPDWPETLYDRIWILERLADRVRFTAEPQGVDLGNRREGS